VSYEVVRRKPDSRSWEYVEGFSQMEKPLSKESFKQISDGPEIGYIYALRERRSTGEIGKQIWVLEHRLELGEIDRELEELEREATPGPMPTDPDGARRWLAERYINGEISEKKFEVITENILELKRKGWLDDVETPEEITIDGTISPLTLIALNSLSSGEGGELVQSLSKALTGSARSLAGARDPDGPADAEIEEPDIENYA